MKDFIEIKLNISNNIEQKKSCFGSLSLRYNFTLLWAWCHVSNLLDATDQIDTMPHSNSVDATILNELIIQIDLNLN